MVKNHLKYFLVVVLRLIHTMQEAVHDRKELRYFVPRHGKVEFRFDGDFIAVDVVELVVGLDEPLVEFVEVHRELVRRHKKSSPARRSNQHPPCVGSSPVKTLHILRRRFPQHP